jgi:hypothetical protein
MQDVSAPITALSISTGMSESRFSVSNAELRVVTGLAAVLGAAAATPARSNTDAEGALQPQPQVAGAPSSQGWHTLQLLPGEAVVGVSVCAGGYVERLVLHTSTGRVWGPPLSADDSCTLDYEEWAPQGGYLVGLQVSVGWGGNAC